MNFIKKNIDFKFASILLFCVFISCDQLKQVDRVLKKTFGQVNRFERQKNNYSKRLGFDKKNNKESSGQIDNSIDYNTIEQKNMINEHGYLFEIINGVDPGKVVNSNEIIGPEKVYVVTDTVNSVAKNVEVFGWHPHWMKSKWKNYPFNLLSTISYFSYNIDPQSGAPLNPSDLNEWSESEFVSIAKKNNTRVLLTVSLHGNKNVINFLNNNSSWENLFNNVSELIISKNADGIDLNFENLPKSQRLNFKSFVMEFRKHLDNEFYKNNKAKSPFISLTIPASTEMQNYSLSEMSTLKTSDTNREVIDLFIMMGYDYHTKSVPSPTAPLQSEGGGHSLKKTIDIFNSLSAAKDKTILALPYYGIMYDIEPVYDSISNSQVDIKSSFSKKLTYNEINEFFIDNPDLKYQIDLNPLTMSKQLSLVFDDNSMKEIFYDDSFTLSKKYSLAMNSGLKGIGIWALGYDNQRYELWNLIDSYFTSDNKIYSDPIAEVNGHTISFTKSLVKNKNIYFVIIIFLLFSVVIAGLILINDSKVRDKISSSRLISLILLTILYIFLIPLITFINDLFSPIGIYIESSFNLYIAMFLGALIFYIGSKITVKKDERP